LWSDSARGSLGVNGLQTANDDASPARRSLANAIFRPSGDQTGSMS
jgi:hypothetical protein